MQSSHSKLESQGQNHAFRKTIIFTEIKAKTGQALFHRYKLYRPSIVQEEIQGLETRIARAHQHDRLQR